MTYTLSALLLKASAHIAAAARPLIPAALAQEPVFNSPNGLAEGINQARNIRGISQSTNVKQFVITVIEAVLNFITLLAVIVVIVAGIRLIVSMGNDEQKDKAKKSMIYMLIGLIVIILSRVIVLFIVNFFPAA